MFKFFVGQNNKFCSKAVQDDLQHDGIDVSDIPTETLIAALTNALSPVGMGWMQHLSLDHPFYLKENDVPHLYSNTTSGDKIEKSDMYTGRILFKKHKVGTRLRMDYILGRPIKSDIYIYDNGKKILKAFHYDHSTSSEKLEKIIQGVRQGKEVRPSSKEYLDSLPEQINPSERTPDLTLLFIIKSLVEKIKPVESNNKVVSQKSNHIPLNKRNEHSR